MFPPAMVLSNVQRPSRAWNLPNILTYGRVLAVPVLAGCILSTDAFWMRWLALGIFIAAGVTDFFDGYLARAWQLQSSLGRMLDPIADKLLVAATLLVLVNDRTITGWSVWAAIVILCREILVSGLREFLAELNVSVPVTRVAKYKTTLQLIAVGFLIAGPAGDVVIPGTSIIGLVLLWVSALLTLYTGWDYMKAGSSTSWSRPVKLVYFAWVRERIGKTEEELDPPAGIDTVGALIRWLRDRGENYAYAFENAATIRAAVDRTHARHEAAIAGAREIAFFPPMTGG